MKNIVATFSIVAFDPQTESFGVAVQSKFLGVGAVVPWAKAGAGAVATQAMANYTYGPRGIELMSQSNTAAKTIDILTGGDSGREHRQLGVVDANGRPATFTGGECFEWAGGVTGEHYAAQGNILVGPGTVEAMSETFEAADGDLAARLLLALDAGQAAGGDRRGMQSAALLVVREGGGYGGDNDRLVDLRVDEHHSPIKELTRIRELHTLYFGETKPEDIVAVDGDVRRDVVAALSRLGYLRSDDPDEESLHNAVRAFIGTENFEEREQERGYLDRAVFDFLKDRARNGK